MRSIRTIVLVCGLIVVAPLCVGGCHINAGDWSRAHYERTVELQHPMADGSTLAVSTASGSIDVTGQAVNEAQVVATIRGQAPTEEEAQEIAEQTEIRLEPAGDRVTIKADTPRLGNRRSVSVSYVITAPRQTSIECGSASGSIRAAHLQGSVRANAASGSVTCEDIRGGEVRLGSASGSVRLSDAAELSSCELQTSSGRASANRIQATDRIRVASTSGSVELSDARARTIEMHGTSGHVEGRGIDCSRLTAECASGGISVEFSSSAPADVTAVVRSISGGVSVVAPPGFAGRVEMSTTSGSVHSDLPLLVQGRVNTKHLSGSIGTGSGSLTLRTTSGSVRLR